MSSFFFVPSIESANWLHTKEDIQGHFWLIEHATQVIEEGWPIYLFSQEGFVDLFLAVNDYECSLLGLIENDIKWVRVKHEVNEMNTKRLEELYTIPGDNLKDEESKLAGRKVLELLERERVVEKEV